MAVVVPAVYKSVKFFRPWTALMILAVVFFALPSNASTSLQVSWSQSSDTNVLGYKVYYGTASQQYTNTILAGNVTNIMVSGIQPGVRYYFAATSYNAAGWESSFSPEISYIVPVGPAPLSEMAISASGFSFMVNGMASNPYVVLASTNLINWVALATNMAPFLFTDANASQYGHRYYKAVLESNYKPQISAVPSITWPALKAPIRSQAGFSFNVEQTSGANYVVLASTNLVNWTALATNMAPFTFTDGNSFNFNHRYYKAVLESAYVP